MNQARVSSSLPVPPLRLKDTRAAFRGGPFVLGISSSQKVSCRARPFDPPISANALNREVAATSEMARSMRHVGMSFDRITVPLNEIGDTTGNGKPFHAMAARRLLERMEM